MVFIIVDDIYTLSENNFIISRQKQPCFFPEKLFSSCFDNCFTNNDTFNVYKCKSLIDIKVL